MKNTTVLIDGDEFIHRASAAFEQEIRWDEQNHVLYCNEEAAWANLVGMIDRIFDRFDTEHHWLLFSQCNAETPNFRLSIDPTYKAHRVGGRKPLCYVALRERVAEKYRVHAVPGLEADDLMGILATGPNQKTNKVIVSQDKDMKTIPATVWNGKDLVTYSEDEADYWHMYQTLVGDTADGYKGCPGCGPVKAEKILSADDHSLETAQEVMWASVVRAYEKAGLTEADALVQARLARILRWDDWDAEKKQPILWSPK